MTGLAELPALNDTRFGPIRVVAETGSTNADLLAAAAAGAPEGSVLVTDHQTAGRGRQRRSWHDEPGNALLVSVLLRPRRSLAPLLPLLTGVAAVEAIGTLCEPRSPAGSAGAGSPAGLKWPNDVLAPSLSERKLAGILAESSTVAPGAPWAGDGDTMIVVSGMGMNLRWARPPPDEIRDRAATVSELLGREIDRDEILHRYLRCLEYWLCRAESNGHGDLLDRYRRYSLTLGRRLRFATATEEYLGLATEISATGTLLLQTDDRGTVELHAGDAHHLP